MALPTAEPVRVAKQYRVLYRCEDGVVCYESVNDTEGSELLIWNADGNLYRQSIAGVDWVRFVVFGRLRVLSTRCGCRMMRGGRCGRTWSLSLSRLLYPSLSRLL
jgi:hypothetical protein